MQRFRDMLNHCKLSDLGFSGLPWTYDNKKVGHRNVKVRLDWGAGNPEWRDLFLDMEVKHRVSTSSDHYPILLCTKPPKQRTANRTLRYETMWECEKTLGDEIGNTWRPVDTKEGLGDIASMLSTPEA